MRNLAVVEGHDYLDALPDDAFLNCLGHGPLESTELQYHSVHLLKNYETA